MGKAVGTLPKGQEGVLPFAECFFTVTVTDDQNPKCDSRELECSPGSRANATKPFHICAGPLLDIEKDQWFEKTLTYDILGVTQEPDYPSAGCCDSALDVEHVCDIISESAGTAPRVCVPHDFHGEIE